MLEHSNLTQRLAELEIELERLHDSMGCARSGAYDALDGDDEDLFESACDMEDSYWAGIVEVEEEIEEVKKLLKSCPIGKRA